MKAVILVIFILTTIGKICEVSWIKVHSITSFPQITRPLFGSSYCVCIAIKHALVLSQHIPHKGVFSLQSLHPDEIL